MAGMDLGKQVGPLPLGAWIAVVGGGLALAWYSMQQQDKSTPAPVVEDTSGVPGVGTGPGWIAVTPPTSAPDTSKPEPATNEEWGKAAINYLIAQGYDANMADSAIRKYLEASQLNSQEYALVRYALEKLGSPPVPLPTPPPPPVVDPPANDDGGGTVAPPPPPAPPPAPPAIRIHVVTPWPTKGSTLWGISELYYGTGTRWPEIYNANRAGTTRPDGSPGFISNPDYLRPGDRVYVP